jgi:hypothetical protein
VILRSRTVATIGEGATPIEDDAVISSNTCPVLAVEEEEEERGRTVLSESFLHACSVRNEKSGSNKMMSLAGYEIRTITRQWRVVRKIKWKNHLFSLSILILAQRGKRHLH